MCTAVNGFPYQDANSFYSQAASATTIQVSPLTIGGTPCNNPGCQNSQCDGTCMPELVQAVYKTNNSTARQFTHEYLLRPGNISARQNCGVDYTNNWEMYAQAPPIHEFTPGAASYDSFDIRDNKFVTNFRNGVVHLLFYVEAFIKFKMFETLTNQTNDETFNQLQQKLVYHKQAYEEAFIMADIEVKKQTPWEKQRRIKNDLNRFNMYELPNRTNRYGRRRNN